MKHVQCDHSLENKMDKIKMTENIKCQEKNVELELEYMLEGNTK